MNILFKEITVKVGKEEIGKTIEIVVDLKNGKVKVNTLQEDVDLSFVEVRGTTLLDTPILFTKKYLY